LGCQFDLLIFDVSAVISKLIDQPVCNLAKKDVFTNLNRYRVKTKASK
jgi:hypothetical protein